MNEENQNERSVQNQQVSKSAEASSGEQAASQREDMNEAIALAEEENFSEAVKKIGEMEQKVQAPLTGEAFADSEPVIPAAEANLKEEYAGRAGIKAEYDLKAEEVSPALLLFQKRTIFKRNAIYTAILAVIFVLYVVSVIVTPSYTPGYFMLVICATVVAFLWYLPYRHRRSTAAASDSVDDRFQLTFYDDSVLVGEGDAMYRISYEKDQVKAISRRDMLILTVGRERLFVVPLRCVGESTMEQICSMLKNALNENFIDESEFAAGEKISKKEKESSAGQEQPQQQQEQSEVNQ